MEAARTNKNNIQALAMIQLLRKDKMSYRAIAERLNELQYKTSKGSEFEAISVSRILNRS
jgi:hypothetical protein